LSTNWYDSWTWAKAPSNSLSVGPLVARSASSATTRSATDSIRFGEPVIRHELARHGLTDHLAFVMVSSDYSVRKPNVLLYETAAARLNVKAGDIWFVGDRLDTDVTGAKAAGMTAVWFNPQGRANPLSDVDLAVSGWADLVGHVGPPGVVNGPPEQSY